MHWFPPGRLNAHIGALKKREPYHLTFLLYLKTKQFAKLAIVTIALFAQRAGFLKSLNFVSLGHCALLASSSARSIR